MKVQFSDLSIGVHAALSADHPKIYNHVKITYKIKLAEEDKSKMIKAVGLSTENIVVCLPCLKPLPRWIQKLITCNTIFVS